MHVTFSLFSTSCHSVARSNTTFEVKCELREGNKEIMCEMVNLHSSRIFIIPFNVRINNVTFYIDVSSRQVGLIHLQARGIKQFSHSALRAFSYIIIGVSTLNYNCIFKNM